MDFYKITTEYYSHWVGADLNDKTQGVHIFYNQDRNKALYGYDSPFDLWILKIENRIFISYGDRADRKIMELQQTLKENMDVKKIAEAVRAVYQGRITTGIKYVFDGNHEKNERGVSEGTKPDIDIGKGAGEANLPRPLTKEDYPAYLAFHTAVNPGDFDRSWVREYFEEMLEIGGFCGKFADRKLVSCTDLPGMPYMQSCVSEIGINTLKEYRQLGYAKDVCRAAIRELVGRERCPVWSAASDNTASQKLAESIGFVPFGEYLTIRMK